ncbi:hypothetical protein PMAYCL1PPCAC_08858, partial [Pristionchus mayeri]
RWGSPSRSLVHCSRRHPCPLPRFDPRRLVPSSTKCSNLKFRDLGTVSVHVRDRTRCRFALSIGDAGRMADLSRRVDISQFDEHPRDHHSIGLV